MIYLLVIGFCLIVFVWISWQLQRRNNPLIKAKNKLVRVINLGSTYAYYDFDYSESNLVGANCANVPQDFFIDQIILKKLNKHIECGTTIILGISLFSFVAEYGNTDKKDYYEFFTPWELPGFSIIKFLELILLAVKEPFTHGYEKQRNRWNGYVATYEEKTNHAIRRVSDWENKVGVPSVSSGSVPDELRIKMRKNMNILQETINFCYENNLKPILVISPVSEIMQQYVSKECLQAYLYTPIEEVKNNTGVEVLDYCFDEKWSNHIFYLNSDCLNQQTRIEFTSQVLSDLKNI